MDEQHESEMIDSKVKAPIPEAVSGESDKDIESPEIIVPPEEEVFEFADAGMHEDLVNAVQGMNWLKPTKVQGLCLPTTLRGGDLVGFAQTGTGKTGVFLLTIADRILKMRKENPELSTRKGRVLALIMSPTRELAMQIEADAAPIFRPVGISSLAVFGGVEYDEQSRALNQGTDVVMATPGRLKDYLQKKIFDISGCQIFVCDEADRMFDMGFIDDVIYFLDRLPEKNQRLLFSATTSESVGELAFEYLDKPRYVSATPESITPDSIEQKAIICDASKKLQVMIGMLRTHLPTCAIVFTNTKITAEWLHFKLNGNGLESDIITGDLPQKKRISLIKRIKAGEIKALIATDVASRGLHIANVSHVYNFDLPDDPNNYIHRIGRTARAGAKGTAISLVCEDYGENLRPINELLGALALKTEWYDPSFEKIEDIAGNPFPNGRESKESRGDHGRHQDRRPGARSDSRGGGGGGGPRNQQSNDRRPRSDQQHQSSDQRRPRSDRPQQHQQQRHQHHDRPKRFTQPVEPMVKTEKTMTPVAATAPKGILDIFGRIFSSLLGRKKK